LAATMIILAILLQTLPLLASFAAFLCLIPAQCECPDIKASTQ
jgi:hypothetical protein